jgi:hypothetical protein
MMAERSDGMMTAIDGVWTPYLQEMDTALAAHDASAAVRAWRRAYAAALASPGWLGLVDVAAASLRIGRIPGFARASEARARETYWTALFRARQDGSLNGVLETAEAFGMIGDRSMVEQCIRIAESLAALTADGRAVETIRELASRLAERFLTTEPAG